MNSQPSTLNPQLTIITYHYVRPLANSRYPNLKALDYDLFKKQIEFITKNYTVVRMEDVIRMQESKGMLSWEASKPLALLAFDDGYIDHYTYVFPILQQYGIQGSFFIPVKPIVENTALDVNKIHLILEKAEPSRIIQEIRNFIAQQNHNGKNLKSVEEYRKEYDEYNRFDNADVMFIKRFLQKWNNIELRSQLVNHLFSIFIDADEKMISQELYMNPDQIRHMHRAGMYIGGHTYNHYHLGSQTLEEQQFEIRESANFLINKIGINQSYLTLSYPYGSHNNITKEVLNHYSFKLGIGIDYGVADLKTMDCFNVPRIDCNDITKMMNGN